ncbi:MAG TPA: FAD-linked oxidase C-terminal domain-containing protein [Abditibacteriaceae bacterium]|nr:FAD-linked oxidase C-terminal domain-containing protein [Abditibacteriaceae bacterium]
MTPQLLSALQSITGADGVLSADDELLVYECDAYVAAKRRPQAVVFPTSTEQVAAVVKLARHHDLSVVPRGAGTGLAGGCLAESDSIMVVLSRMNQIQQVDIPNRRALVEAGVVNLHLTQLVAPHGFCYAPDPSSQAACTIGGNISNNSGGPHTLKYGVTVNHTLGVELVLPDGEVVWLGGAVEGALGYDLLGACVGSEGTFGIVTRAWVKLTRVPEAANTMLAIFDDFDAASQAVSNVIAAGIIPAALEMLDDVFIPAIEQAYKLGFPLDAAAILLIETDGLKEAAADEASRAAAICKESGAREVRLAKDERERKLLWKARKGAFGALGRVTPSYVTQDGVVPRSKLAPMLKEVKRIAAEHKVLVANVFHAGDGNLHPCILFDERDTTQLPRVLEAGEEILRCCIDYGGSVTGEHGIGIEKINLMEYAFTAETLAAMGDLRAVFNPDNSFNPAKVLPSSRGCVEIGKAYSVAAESAAQASTFLHRGAPV